MKNVTYINAGAGSGKTYTLTQQLVDLISQHKAQPEQVILTTFTIKAANEFKEKAKAELYKVGLFDEAARLDHALIGTVHSVCQRMIAKYWFLLGLAPDMGVMADEDAAYYMSQSLADLPTDQELVLLHRHARNFDIRKKDGFMYTYQLDNDFWKEDLRKIIAYTVNYGIADYAKSEAESLAFIAQFVDKSIRLSYSASQLKAVLDEHLGFLNQQKASGTRDGRIAELQELYRGYLNPTPAWYAKVGKLMSAIKSCGPLTADFREQAVKVWNSKMVYDEQKTYIHLIFELAKRWRDRFARFKQEKNLLDFNDMEKYMHQLMLLPQVAQEVGKSYRYLFVDEFQDSSPIQVKIFDALSNLMQASYWVGDYKQAIYGFRGSDIKLVKAIVDGISQKKDGCDTRTLDTSWRSLPDIVEVDNQIFTQTFKGVLKKENVQLKKHRENTDKIKSLRYFRSTDERGVAAHVAKLVMLDHVLPQDIGILARTNGELDQLSCVLKNDYGIPVFRDNLEVVSTRTYGLVRSLLQVLNSSCDHLAKAEVVWLVEKDMTAKQLIERKILNDDAVRNHESDAKDENFLLDVPLIANLLRIKSHLQQQSVGALVESLIIELNLFDVVKSIATDTYVCDSCLQVIINAAKTYEDHCVQMNLPATVDGFINYIEEVNPMGGADAKGVQLYTYHSCKGLEQKYVILMSLNNDEGNEAKIIRNEIYGVHAVHVFEPSIDQLYPEVYVRVVPWVYGSNRKTPDVIRGKIVDSDSYKLCQGLMLAEANRLLYVGMTRPRDVMLLEAKTGKKGKNPLQWFLSEGYQNIADIPEYGDCDIFGTGLKFADYTVTDEENDRMAEYGILSKELPKRLLLQEKPFETLPPRYLSPSEIRRKGNVVDSFDFGKRISLGAQPESMALVGDCIHQLFAYIEDGISDGSKVQADFFAKMKNTICLYGLEAVLVYPEEIVEAWNNLVSFLTDKFEVPQRTCHERPFRLERDGQTLVGSIDLVWETQKGSIVVDYKTCPMGAKAVLDAESEHYAGWYAGQLDAYTDALNASDHPVLARFIYYPVAGIIAEIGCDDEGK